MENLLIQGLSKFNDFADKSNIKTPLKDDYLMIKRLGTTGKAAALKGDAGDDKLLKGILPVEKEKKKREPKPKEPLVDYEIFMPDIKGPDANKFFSDPLALTGFLTSTDDTFMKAADNFQRMYLHEEPRIWWQFEKVANFGDFVLLFPNPDFKELEPDLMNGISLTDALYWYEAIIESSQLEFSGKRKFMTALNTAFQQAFVKLDEFIPLKESEKKALELQRTEVTKTQSQGNAADKSGIAADADGLFSVATKANRGFEDVQKEPKDDPADSKSLGKGGDSKANPAKELMSKALKEKASQMFGSPAKSSKGGQTPRKGGGGPKASKEQKKAAYKKPGEEDDDFDTQKTKLRKIWGGGLYTKPTTSQEEGSDDPPENKFYWSRAPLQSTGDFLTLMRKTVAVVLAQQGFVMREIFVNDGKQIAMVITFPEQNLHKYAIQIKMPRTAEFGVLDLFSLEPIDSKGRPLRFNKVLFDEGGWKRKYIAEPYSMFDELNPFKQDIKKWKLEADRINKLREHIIALLDGDCNFARIARMTQFIQWDLMEEEASVASDIESHEYVPLNMWEEFYAYLVSLSIRIHEIRHIKDKIKLIIDVHYGDGRVAVHGREKRRRFDTVELQKFIAHEVTRAMVESIEGTPTLKNIWSKKNLKPPSYRIEYTTSNNNMRPRSRMFFDSIWRDFLVGYEQPKAPPYDQDLGRFASTGSLVCL